MPNTVTFQSGCSKCTVPSALGGGLLSDLEKQIRSLMPSTKKTVKRKKTSTKKSPAKRKPTTKKKVPAKRKPTTKKKAPTKRKPTTKKKAPAKRKPTTKKKTPAKRKPTTKKKTSAKRKLTRSKTVKGGATPRPREYYSGGAFSMEQAGNFNKSLQQLGGGSSDFIGTVSSRGPVNYTNSEGSGLSGEQLFRTFNKTGTYMPHDKVNYGSVLTDGILGRTLTGGRRIR